MMKRYNLCVDILFIIIYSNHHHHQWRHKLGYWGTWSSRFFSRRWIA